MRYLEINTGPVTGEGKLPWWVRFLQQITPAASPDVETYFDKASVWWLEIGDDGEPQREIGFDQRGTPIVLGPVEGNYGYLMDASDDWSDSTEDSAEAARKFDSVWTSLWPEFEELDRRNHLKGV